MEKKRLSCSYALLVIILFTVVCFLTDYIIIDRKLNGNRSTVETIIERSDCIQSVCNCLDNNPSVYDSFSSNLKSQIGSVYNDYTYSMKYVENSFVPDGYVIRLDNNGSLFVKYDSDNEIKIADNVLSFYVINTGQDVGNTLYFINSDGTVGKASPEFISSNNGDISIVSKIDGLNNIVSIVDAVFGDGYSGYHGPLFIDIDGNIFKR